ncbi:probable disease resistance protein At4g27220 [Prosopis cineraria]|uniref:probable disease resistance protein At4g27220 n=1 Tax=Prosopis cineraria TaxID=364024 RepID=UPI00240F9CA5|nr:probable disease resistance protein At4g27220 [Prosopis cineraria]
MRREVRYCYQFNELVEELGDEQNNLMSTTNDMLAQLRRERANCKEPSYVLQRQLLKAEYLIGKAETLKHKAEASQSCCYGACPNWIRRYIVGKKAEKETVAMKYLNASLRRELLPLLQPMGPAEDFILFKSTEEARNNILKALRDDEKIKIGLCGPGGCGKSTLLKEVHKEVNDSKLYQTAFVVVSHPPNYHAIQESIASWMGLEFGPIAQNVRSRAARLCMEFGMVDKKFLIILDDVWQELDFEAIGIPIGENCKVLLSTRRQQICDIMEFREMIYLSLLTEEESWQFFQRHAGEIKDTFQQAACELTRECGGLPIAIKATASTLRGQEHFAWKDALATLKERGWPLNIEEGLDDAFTSLKFSLDSLKHDAEELSLYLLCALFPKDLEIAIEVLIRFAFGLGIFQGIDSYQGARSKVHAAIDKFSKYCLLLQERQYVKLHELLHDLALWESKEKTQVIMGPRQIVTLTEAIYMKDTNRLYCHDIREIPDQLICPELEILVVSNNGGYSSKFPYMFFKEMVKLKVLAIKNTSIGMNPVLLLPESIDRLKMLRTL